MLSLGFAVSALAIRSSPRSERPENGVQAPGMRQGVGLGSGPWGGREMGSADGTGGYSADSYDTGARLTINPVNWGQQGTLQQCR